MTLVVASVSFWIASCASLDCGRPLKVYEGGGGGARQRRKQQNGGRGWGWGWYSIAACLVIRPLANDQCQMTNNHISPIAPVSSVVEKYSYSGGWGTRLLPVLKFDHRHTNNHVDQSLPFRARWRNIGGGGWSYSIAARPEIRPLTKNNHIDQPFLCQDGRLFERDG